MRINQFIARAGITSRRKAEDIIKAGRVFVNGQIISDLSTEVDPEKDVVEVAGEEIKLPKLSYFALNKPTGYTVTKDDPYAKHTIFELLPKDPSLFPVGRLDRETAGLLLVTNDGDFAQNIIHPRKKVEKEYIVRTLNPVTKDQLGDLKQGLELDDGPAVAKRAERISDKEIVMVIEMGRKRVVRRMIDYFGNKVTGLKRTRIGNIMLDVESGKYRPLTKEEINEYLT